VTDVLPQIVFPTILKSIVTMKPLVSILIPAYNAHKWIAYTIQSALGQTWPRKEVIVIDDGSTDTTAAIVRQFASRGVKLLSTANQGLSAAQNEAFKLSQGDYIQWLDADDLLALDKVERQLNALRESDNKRILLSSPWAPFFYRTQNVRFVRNSLWQDLSPVEWLLRKLREPIHMQNATWLVSRELTEAAGPWDTRLQYDQDGEYFARVLLASEGTRFVPDTGIFYRVTTTNRISYIGKSNKKKDSLFLSMKLHIQYLSSLEDSERVRKACVAYLQNWYHTFYPERSDIVREMQELAGQLGGHLEPPALRWKYAWMRPVFGWHAAKSAQNALPQFKAACLRKYDRAVFLLGELRAARLRPVI
jgi:glycosyltransferase involved in cell wall biosynthesis